MKITYTYTNNDMVAKSLADKTFDYLKTMLENKEFKGLSESIETAEIEIRKFASKGKVNYYPRINFYNGNQMLRYEILNGILDNYVLYILSRGKREPIELNDSRANAVLSLVGNIFKCKKSATYMIG